MFFDNLIWFLSYFNLLYLVCLASHNSDQEAIAFFDYQILPYFSAPAPNFGDPFHHYRTTYSSSSLLGACMFTRIVNTYS